MNTGVSERKRGGCLTAFLVLMLIANTLTAFSYLFGGSAIRASLPGLPEWVIPVLIVLTVANIVCAIGVWTLKKWGVYGFGVTSGAAFVINAINFGILAALVGLIGMAILVALVRPIWHAME